MFTTNVDTAAFTEEDRAAFIYGWELAGGYTDDYTTARPWGRPWTHENTTIEVWGTEPEHWGKAWWAVCKDQVIAALRRQEHDKAAHIHAQAEG